MLFFDKTALKTKKTAISIWISTIILTFIFVRLIVYFGVLIYLRIDVVFEIKCFFPFIEHGNGNLFGKLSGNKPRA